METVDSTRAFVKNVKRVIVKVGTAVVTRADGRLALGRLGALCEQIHELNSQGYEVVLVTSGAVGVGRQRLRYRKLLNSSFLDLQKPQTELDGKACAAVGQNGLMALYDTLFSQDSSGIFWDNDSLAALLALELKADLLVLLSDVDGLYSGPPRDPDSKLIHTYIKEKHDRGITFGDKSRVGRGGMTAKVKAAVYAAYAGIPVVITSGYAVDNIIKVLQGERIGTLFHRDADTWASIGEFGAREMAVAARECSRRLQALSSQERSKILQDIADALEANEKAILTENEADMVAAQQAGYEKSLIARLALKPGKIADLANSVRALANMDEPLGRILKRTEVADGFILEKSSSPLGVLLIIFESRPDALVQIASLALRSGNGLLLKGGKEAKRSNAILHKVITSAIPATVGERLIGLVNSREEIPELLKHDDVIDLVIPRGSNKLVSQIKASTKIPVLGHADGICHVYVDKSADMDMAKRIVVDAKTDYPAACNAMETLLVHKDLAQNGGLNDLIVELQTKGVSLYGGPKASSLLKIPEARIFHQEYSSLACTVEVVEDVYAAMDHIHQHGSAHSESIITEDQEVAEVFLRQVDSAAVFHNASTRFSDGFRFGLGAEVGISTGRIHARGPVGVEGLLTTKWLARGNGQIVDGDKTIVYTHKDLTQQA
ncbi:delta-1-pyrroline-5-carboxylate synthase isoform X2 [Lycium ferocissimum]|uniref:delta-1-pyrroline-5-carboxylate synthase isoform X2 n=1 Tax=Lycium ferocissimum TaxID=112874 RepID=UPI0028151082|nr:delta-1-pyrroline-5-carboxylate synthase isoform X2 [Lycium ferocissimum]